MYILIYLIYIYIYIYIYSIMLYIYRPIVFDHLSEMIAIAITDLFLLTCLNYNTGNRLYYC